MPTDDSLALLSTTLRDSSTSTAAPVVASAHHALGAASAPVGSPLAEVSALTNALVGALETTHRRLVHLEMMAGKTQKHLQKLSADISASAAASSADQLSRDAIAEERMVERVRDVVDKCFQEADHADTSNASFEILKCHTQEHSLQLERLLDAVRSPAEIPQLDRVTAKLQLIYDEIKNPADRIRLEEIDNNVDHMRTETRGVNNGVILIRTDLADLDGKMEDVLNRIPDNDAMKEALHGALSEINIAYKLDSISRGLISTEVVEQSVQHAMSSGLVNSLAPLLRTLVSEEVQSARQQAMSDVVGRALSRQLEETLIVPLRALIEPAMIELNGRLFKLEHEQARISDNALHEIRTIATYVKAMDRDQRSDAEKLNNRMSMLTTTTTASEESMTRRFKEQFKRMFADEREFFLRQFQAARAESSASGSNQNNNASSSSSRPTVGGKQPATTVVRSSGVSSSSSRPTTGEKQPPSVVTKSNGVSSSSSHPSTGGKQPRIVIVASPVNMPSSPAHKRRITSDERTVEDGQAMILGKRRKRQ